MVQVGIICEGDTELILFESDRFKAYLNGMGINLVRVINAEGSGNLLPHNIGGYLRILQDEGAEHILIVTDLDTDACVTLTKNRISAPAAHIVVIARKQIEAWYLADTPAIRLLLNDPAFEFKNPEDPPVPFQTINQLLIRHRGYGIGNHSAGKIKLAKWMLKYGWTLTSAAEHANCSSAKYLVQKLQGLATT
jgi:hypothetical protein